MVLLRFLNGARQGTEFVASSFPLNIGRSSDAQVRLEAAGVWDRHARITADRSEGIVLATGDAALTLVNGQPIERVRLRNGDLIEWGGVKARFWISPARQAGLRLRETLTWLGLFAFMAAEVGLCWWLCQ